MAEDPCYCEVMRPVFADPKTDFIFKRIFGSEPHKQLLVELLNTLLEKAEEKGVARGRVKELRRSLADLCELLGIEMSEEHQEVLTAASLTTLERLGDRIEQERRWPGEL